MKTTLCVLVLAAVLSCVSTANACPMCKTATQDSALAEADPNAALQPQAYAASIMFMLAVPAAIFSTLGYGLYRMSQAEGRQLEQTNGIDRQAEKLA